MKIRGGQQEQGQVVVCVCVGGWRLMDIGGHLCPSKAKRHLASPYIMDHNSTHWIQSDKSNLGLEIDIA